MKTTEQDPRTVLAKSLRIDPAARTITAAVDSWNSALEWIGADLLERVGCGSGVDCWIDEEGMLRDGADHWILGGEQLLAGRAVVVGGVGGEWTDLPIPTGVVAAAVGWIPKAFKAQAQEIADGMRPVAVAWNAEGMAQLEKMNREHAGRVELLAVAAVQGMEMLGLGDCVTGPDGITGFVQAINGDRVTVLTLTGTPVFDRAELVKVEEID
jgi:hypothetical protein